MCSMKEKRVVGCRQSMRFLGRHQSNDGTSFVCCSVHLDVNVNVSDESKRRKETDCPQHEKENITGDRRVTEELQSLQSAAHLRSIEVEKYGVNENEHSGWSKNEALLRNGRQQTRENERTPTWGSTATTIGNLQQPTGNKLVPLKYKPWPKEELWKRWSISRRVCTVLGPRMSRTRNRARRWSPRKAETRRWTFGRDSTGNKRSAEFLWRCSLFDMEHRNWTTNSCRKFLRGRSTENQLKEEIILDRRTTKST